MKSTDPRCQRILMQTRMRLALQLLGTLTALAWLPGNFAKLVVFLLIWAIGFGAISRRELLGMITINLLFVGMNAGALAKGVFHFRSPDALGMPAYEFFMWGFYTLNTVRFLGGRTPRGRWWVALLMATIFALPFLTVEGDGLLTAASGLALVLGLVVYHEKMDFAYFGYLVIMGAMIEYIGVASGQWAYPGNPPGGVPLWFITMWGGVGLYTRRLLLPALRGNGARKTKATS